MTLRSTPSDHGPSRPSSPIAAELAEASCALSSVKYPNLLAYEAVRSKLPLVGDSLRAKLDGVGETTLLTDLQSVHFYPREAAAGLAQGVGAKGLEILTIALDSPFEHTTRTVLSALVRSLREGSLDQDIDGRNRLAQKLSRITTAGTVNEKIPAAYALSLLTGRLNLSIAPLLEALHRGSATARVQAAEVLVAHDDTRHHAVKAIVRLIRGELYQLEKDHWTQILEARREAIRIAGNLKSPFPVDLTTTIIEVLDHDPCLDLRRAIVHHAGEYAEGAIPILDKALTLREDGITDRALDVAGGLGRQALPLNKRVVGLVFSNTKYSYKAWEVKGLLNSWTNGS